MEKIKLSIIIPTFNRANLLNNTLESIIKQSFLQKNFEVLIIDNGSIDNTEEIVRTFESKINNLRYFFDATPGLHVGRHIGLKEAKSDILVYCDDDIEALPLWLETIWNCFQNDDVVIVGGKNLPKFECSPPQWLYEMWMQPSQMGNFVGYLSILDFGDKICNINPNYIWGCNFAIRKNILIQAGGFHPDSFPQELIRFRGDGESSVTNYIQNKNYLALYHPLASIYHFVSKSRMNDEYFCRRAFNQGVSDSFTQIRKQNSLEVINDSVLTNKKSKRNWFKFKYEQFSGNRNYQEIKELKELLNLLYNEINQLKNICLLSELEKKIKISFQRGYEFHQNEVKKDPKLLEWVLKPDYFDYDYIKYM